MVSVLATDVLPPADVADADVRPTVAAAATGVVSPTADASVHLPAPGEGDLLPATNPGLLSIVAGASLLSPSASAEASTPVHC
jgi:hypothetical protein